VANGNSVYELRAELRHARHQRDAFRDAYLELDRALSHIERVSDRARSRRMQRVAAIADRGRRRAESLLPAHRGDNLSAQSTAMITDVALRDLERQIADSIGSAARIEAARSLPPGVTLSVRQLLRLLKAADFDSVKVDLAAALYPRIVDPENFPRVYAALDFHSSRKSLRKRLQSAHDSEL
jgi:hypothetical protein